MTKATLPVPLRLQPQGVTLMNQDITKPIAVKFPNSTRATENHLITPGTTARDLLIRLRMDPSGFEVLDGQNTRAFAADEILYAQVHPGDLLHVAAQVNVGAART
jgi:hypothetical protein